MNRKLFFVNNKIEKNERYGVNMQLKESKTIKNLANAFSGESQAHIRYKFLAYGAKQKQLFEVEKAIKEIVENEFQHARMFFTAIQSSGSETINNLEVCSGYPFKEKWDFIKNFEFAVENEKEENEKIYPEFSKIAKEEGFDNIADLFDLVAKVEDCHKKQLSQIHTHLKNNTLYKRENPVKWKCGLCGHENTAKEAWEICPLCKAPQGNVKLDLSDK